LSPTLAVSESPQPVLEGVHVAGRSALAFQSSHARFVLQDSFSHSCLTMAK
jgi:hypothetical protein